MSSLCLDGFCLGALVSPINPKHVQQAKSHVVLTKTSNIFSDRLPQWTKGLVNAVGIRYFLTDLISTVTLNC